jgi:hypothetical protein
MRRGSALQREFPFYALILAVSCKYQYICIYPDIANVTRIDKPAALGGITHAATQADRIFAAVSHVRILCRIVN